MVSGLSATMIEAPQEMQKTLTVPDDHIQQCKDAGLPTEGNAAGNKGDYLNLAGENRSPNRLPAGYVILSPSIFDIAPVLYMLLT